MLSTSQKLQARNVPSPAAADFPDSFVLFAPDLFEMFHQLSLHPRRLSPHNAAENAPVIDVRLTHPQENSPPDCFLIFGYTLEKRLKAGHLHVRQPEKVAHDPVSLRSLNHAAQLKSMGPDPKAFLP